MSLPHAYRWLEHERHPAILVEAVQLYGTIETPGAKNNAAILGWADEIGGWIADYYSDDSIPWCGLFVGVCAKRAGLPVSQKALSAASWASWGVSSPEPALGDILVFKREGGGHVGFYVGEDMNAFHVLGGNQSDAVTVARIDKKRLVAARRTIWRHEQPKNVRRVFLTMEGAMSRNEA